MNLWDYVFTPGGPSLGPVAMLTLIASAFVALGGIALVVVPKELAHLSAMRSTRHVRAEHSEAGPKERELRAELRVKVGAGISAWSGALILSLLLRLLGTRGLETRFLPTLVILALPLLAGYIVVYRLFFYPRYLEVCRRIDTYKSYDRITKKSGFSFATPIPAAPWWCRGGRVKEVRSTSPVSRRATGLPNG